MRKTTARAIVGQYTRLLTNYPKGTRLHLAEDTALVKVLSPVVDERWRQILLLCEADLQDGSAVIILALSGHSEHCSAKRAAQVFREQLHQLSYIYVGSVYRHFKGQKYLVQYVGCRVLAGLETLPDKYEYMPAVFYRPHDGSFDANSLLQPMMYLRPLKDWFEPVVWPDGVTRPRFVPESQLVSGV